MIEQYNERNSGKFVWFKKLKEALFLFAHLAQRAGMYASGLYQKRDLPNKANNNPHWRTIFRCCNIIQGDNPSELKISLSSTSRFLEISSSSAERSNGLLYWERQKVITTKPVLLELFTPRYFSHGSVLPQEYSSAAPQGNFTHSTPGKFQLSPQPLHPKDSFLCHPPPHYQWRLHIRHPCPHLP